MEIQQGCGVKQPCAPSVKDIVSCAVSVVQSGGCVLLCHAKESVLVCLGSQDC